MTDNLFGMCAHLKLPCMNLSDFYKKFAATSFSQLASTRGQGYRVTPCIIYDDEHAFLLTDPRGK